MRRTRTRGVRGAAPPAMIPARRRVILTWSVTLTVATLLVIGGFMMFWLRTHGHKAATAHAAQAMENVRVVSKFVSPGQDEALELVKRALANRDPELVESCFHLGGAKPAEVVEFVGDTEKRDGRIERFDWLSSMDMDGLLMEGVLVVYAGKTATSERLAFLVPDETGVWKVDFDAFARSSRPSWRELLEGPADHARVRVFVARDAYYNGPFLDESRWVCYALASPETREVLPEDRELLRGYCRVGSPQARAMERIFRAGERMRRATLEIRRAEGADSRQFEIARVLSQDWVLSPKPFDEKFQ